MIGEILTHTPVWVFVLFVALLGLGLTQVRERRLSYGLSSGFFVGRAITMLRAMRAPAPA